MTTTTAIIGGGAAGCFAAINLKRLMPDNDITVYESGHRLLAKVAITGGGRCNLTNSFEDVRSTDEVYPRGARLMKRLLKEFSHKDAYGWFESNGVRLVTQTDRCVFPKSQDAMEIVSTLTRLMRESGVKTRMAHRAVSIKRTDNDGTADRQKRRFRIDFANGEKTYADNVVVTTGGSPRRGGLAMLDNLELDIVEPVPSLFSICLPGDDIRELSGTVVDNATVGICGTKIHASGALLITHWGMSGPAILKLSSHAARLLSENAYRAQLTVNWMGSMKEADVAALITNMAARNMQKQTASVYPDCLNSKLWRNILLHNGMKPEQRWAEIGRKGLNKIVTALTNSTYRMDGKNRFKEEFVTCGGVALGNINPATLECRKHEGLYFAGEVLDVDAVTGGFNLQAAWTMGYVVSRAIAAKAGSEKQ